jgi:hypothetical protein
LHIEQLKKFNDPALRAIGMKRLVGLNNGISSVAPIGFPKWISSLV